MPDALRNNAECDIVLTRAIGPTGGEFDMRLKKILIATTMLAFAAPAAAQDGKGVPAFRVPIGGTTNTAAGPAVYAWMQNVGTCSEACGTGTRTTTYQCQDTNDYDFGGSGYGAPEPDASCSSVGTKPNSSSTSCTNYSGCSYTWVKPAPVVTRIAKPNPPGSDYAVGAVDDCSYAKRTFSPYCQRNGPPNVQLPSQDYAFCKNDTPNYNQVAAGDPDARGYDRTTDVSTACIPGGRDNAWKTGDWRAPSSTCSSAPTHDRTVSCFRKFNGATLTEADCAGVAKPATSETMTPIYTSCSYAWETGTYSSWNAGCSSTATRTRSVVCRRSDGQAVADASCTGTKPAASETGPNYESCSYAWTTPSDANWTPAKGCSANLAQTNTTSCRRSDGTTVADTSCTASSRPATSRTVANYDTCTYTPRDQGATTCTAQGSQQQYWDCTRSDGATGYPANFCGKTNPETRTCTPSKSPYTPRDRGYGPCDSNGQRPHYWECTGFDGSTGNPANLCGHTNPEMESCSFTAVNGGTTACSAAGQQTTTWSCRGNQDGQTYPATYCGHQASEVTSCAAPVSYSPRDRGQSACQSNNTRQQYWDCQGTDGQIYPANYCGKTNPETQGCSYVAPITYAWQAGGWSGYNSTCSDSATRTRSVYCQASNGQVVADANCGGGRPTSSETTGVYSSCGYTSSQTAITACNGTSQTVQYRCTRSDSANVANSYCGTGDTGTQACSNNLSCDNAPASPPNTGTPIYGCGGTTIGYYSVSQRSGEGAGGRAVGDARFYDASYCQSRGGTCWVMNRRTHSEYGVYETYDTDVTCTTGSAYYAASFVNDSFDTVQSDVCSVH